ncbi:MAG: hypothetical protein ACHQAX_02120 [Gammaproteobacteria bacterium]
MPEPWKRASFVKAILIPELLSLYDNLHIVIGDTLQSHNIQEWGPLPECTEPFTGSVLAQPAVLEAIKLARERAEIIGHEIETDLFAFLILHPQLEGKITISHWSDKDISKELRIFNEELQDPKNKFMHNLLERIEDSAEARLKNVCEKYKFLSDIHKKLIKECSKQYLIKEIVYFKCFLENEEDAWYPGSFGSKHPLLLVCEKYGRQRFHRLDPSNYEIAKLSIQKIKIILKPPMIQTEKSEYERILFKIKKASNALAHLHEKLISILVEKNGSSGQLDAGIIEEFLDKLNTQTRKQIKMLSSQKQTIE